MNVRNSLAISLAVRELLIFDSLILSSFLEKEAGNAPLRDIFEN